VQPPWHPLHRSSVDRFDTKSPIHPRNPCASSKSFSWRITVSPRVSAMLDEARVCRKVREKRVYRTDRHAEGSFFFPSLSLSSNSIMRSVRVRVVRSSLRFMHRLPLSPSLSTAARMRRALHAKEDKFSVKAKCYGFRHKHPVEHAAPEARTYAPEGRKESARGSKNAPLVLTLDLYARTRVSLARLDVIPAASYYWSAAFSNFQLQFRCSAA